MSYLVDWAQELFGRSGVTMAGAAPISFREIESWMRLRGVGNLEPYEVEALLLLDAALISDSETEQKEDVNIPKPTPQWPKRKGS